MLIFSPVTPRVSKSVSSAAKISSLFRKDKASSLSPVLISVCCCSFFSGRPLFHQLQQFGQVFLDQRFRLGKQVGAELGEPVAEREE
ncbi:MAG: hypothetical protein JKP90_10020 [Desulfofustis sp. PB-SRB1]|nr:hypothetical protein [Desulfofustis sp. PB-SRB1]